SHSDPHRLIYMDQFQRKRLMRTDELHKFSDETLNDVRTTLYDIAVEIRIDYLPIRRWSNLDKKRARVTVQDIGKKLYQRSLNQRDLPRDIPLDSVEVLSLNRKDLSSDIPLDSVKVLRPDIVHATCLCARYQAKPTDKHLKEVKRIFRYLWGIVNTGLWYSKDSGFELIGFSDADYAGCKDTFKSTSGGAQFLGEKLVSWSSKKQHCTALSTTEAEYVPLSA
nr:uncharacterized mitochondrial protein AtMg00810-like [Tanacetum cinerariifolium]